MANWTIGYNVWFGPKCAATDGTSSLASELDATNKLISGATAINFVPTSFSLGCPATDQYGTTRPKGAACDAGAHEVVSSGSGPSIGDLNSDSHVNITDLSILLSHYGTSGTPSQGDCNSDGSINITDLSILLSHYGL